VIAPFLDVRAFLHRLRECYDRPERGKVKMKTWVTGLLLGLSALVAEAAAQTPAEFYKGRQLKFIVGTAAGQDYDLWARLIGRHIVRHIPGQPTLIVENMPGAGHIVATNHLFNVAPRDGSVIGMVSRNMTDAAIMKIRNIRFEPGKFNWLGSPEVNHRVLYVGEKAGFSKVPELFERELIVGAPGGAQGVTAAPILLRNLLGMKLKIVTGYRSPGDIVLAVARGEVGGFVNTIGGPEGARRQWLEKGQLRVLFNMEPERVAWLDAPTVFDYTTTEEQRQVLTFFAGNTRLGRPVMAPPEVPADRVAALRRAFDATMKDPAFLKEAQTLGFEVTPQTGEQTTALVAAALATPDAIVQRSIKAAAPD
jgi:tripartite-type tricarboxylate transporter receptor subunit TctC